MNRKAFTKPVSDGKDRKTRPGNAGIRNIVMILVALGCVIWTAYTVGEWQGQQAAKKAIGFRPNPYSGTGCFYFIYVNRELLQ